MIKVGGIGTGMKGASKPNRFRAPSLPENSELNEFVFLFIFFSLWLAGRVRFYTGWAEFAASSASLGGGGDAGR